MMEMKQETGYVLTTSKKLWVFLAMRNFAETLKNKGHQVIYWKLDHPDNTQSLTENLLF
jgi:deoxyribodipyrimidine photolyase-related protein